MDDKSIIEMLHKDTGLPLDYLIKEQGMSNGDIKVDCVNFEHWNLINLAYSECTYLNKYFIYMEKNCCKDCGFYKSKKEVPCP